MKSNEEKVASKLKEVELERDNLLRESQRIKSDFSDCMLLKKNLETRVLTLENELKEAMSVKLNLGECSTKLDRRLSGIQVKNDKQDLGYDSFDASVSSQVPMAKNSPLKKANKCLREVYVCTYCKRRGHLRDFCYKLLRTQNFPREVNRVPQKVDPLNDLKRKIESLVKSSKNLSSEIARISISKGVLGKDKRVMNSPHMFNIVKPKQAWARKREMRESSSGGTFGEEVVDRSRYVCLQKSLGVHSLD